VRVGQLRQMHKYSRTVRQSFEREGTICPGQEVPLPTLVDTESRIAVPAMARGELVGVLVVDSPIPVDFDDEDEAVLTLLAPLIAQMIDSERSEIDAGDRTAPQAPVRTAQRPSGETHVRFFAEDGSVFLDGEYLIRGVAGRILWSLANRYHATGQTEFANKELRLDKSLELPGFRDNLDTRLVMLKRRLDERNAPIRLERTARGRFTLQVATSLRLEAQG
jgi:adenylate cyclase